ncbi:10821_t:CDS:2 [Cetraspora pellucida]|uniref:10821_t:CDS:1 n=1 Tax=Cetraspora pellucida TaxID=1433469 RepID=A0A9N8WTM8_9GLOM|nr:10821_t:CDS:2 [Cetraspora pellucida]
MSIELEPQSQLSFHPGLKVASFVQVEMFVKLLLCGFERIVRDSPFTQLVKEILVVRNPNHEPVAFKVKTTAPKQYCVRPNSGRIEPNQSVEPMKEDPPPDFKCKDKFLVQSIGITPERETLSLQELWAITEKESKDTIKENKIRCVYLPPVGTNLSPTLPSPNQPLPVQSSIPAVPSSPPSGDSAYTESQKLKNDQPLPPPYTNDIYHPIEKNSLGLSEKSILTQAATTNGHSTTQRTPAIVGAFPKDDAFESHNIAKPFRDDDDPAKLRRQLLEAKEEIDRLNHIVENYKQELNTAQMRQRKSEEAAASSNRHSVSAIGGYSVKTQEKIPEGYYPFEVVVGAAVGAFLFGVMFF